jgi:hypothetical protein
MKTFHCDKCGHQVFFENTQCGNCGSKLGYQPELHTISSFEPAGGNAWRSLNKANAGALFRECVNYSIEGVCNWMLPAESVEHLCSSCQLTRVIPALTSTKNRIYWQRLEAAKRRLLYSLWELHLQPKPKTSGVTGGLSFEFLEVQPNKRVMTGHLNGVITLNIAEADAAHRERTREQMDEPYRTLLGHFRHESGHYYFDQLIVGTEWHMPFREVFGNEMLDYNEALRQHYRNGPPFDWDQRFISSYASCHPWEDWAETWAHYLHMIDTLDTAFACGVTVKPKKPLEPELLIEARPLRMTVFEDLMADWFALTYVLNSLNRSIGMPDPYPFTLSNLAMDKLHFIHKVILAKRQSEAALV